MIILHTSEGFTREGTEQEKGSGIGLIICKDFIEKNGGNLFIETDEGTTISFEIPGRKDVGVMKTDLH